MGLNIEYLPFFDLINKLQSFEGRRLAALGSQQMHDPEETLDQFAAKLGYVKFSGSHAPSDLFKERYGIAEYTDFDLNNSASVKLDLGKPLNHGLMNRFDIVLNGGTAEHIFNIAVVFANMHAMASTGGVIINMVPFSWPGHGFYNLDPKLLRLIDRANAYETLVRGWHFPRQESGRVQGLRIVEIAGASTRNAALIQKTKENGIIAKNILYLHVSRKTQNLPFKTPLDVYD